MKRAPSEQHSALLHAMATLEGARRRNATEQGRVAREAHDRAGLANRVREGMLPVLEGGTCELGAPDLAHTLTDEEQRLRGVGVVLDGSLASPDLLWSQDDG